MKSTERHHLKENELAHTLSSAREFIETRRSTVMMAAAVAAVVIVAVVGFLVYRQRTAAGAERLLADAMVALNAPVVPSGAKNEEGLPAAAQIGATNTFGTEEAKLNAALPKLQAAADAYPSTTAGITARYHLGSALAALGKHAEALQAYEAVISAAGADSLYGRMARMGKADAQSRSGQLDAAIATWKELAAQASDDLPADAILMELARAYVQKGNTEDARKTFTEIVDKHPDSPYVGDARSQLESLKG